MWFMSWCNAWCKFIVSIPPARHDSQDEVRFLFYLPAVAMSILVACSSGPSSRGATDAELPDRGVFDGATTDVGADPSPDGAWNPDGSRGTASDPAAGSAVALPNEVGGALDDGGRRGGPDDTDGGNAVGDGDTPYDADDAQFRCQSYPASCASVESTGAIEHEMEVLGDGCVFGLIQTENVAGNRRNFDEVLSRVGGASSLSDVLENLNRQAVPGITDRSADRLRSEQHLGFRWNSADMGTSAWYPQGITGGSDRQDDGRPLGRRLLLVSWYDYDDAPPVKGVRVSLVDITDTTSIAYRHMLLVVPSRDDNGDATFGPVTTGGGNPLHAGGIVWIGDLLYAADTGNGFRVFDMGRILKVPDVDDNDRIGATPGRVDAHGFRYAVPQIARYRRAPGACGLRHSFAGLDRSSSPPSIVSGEYHGDDVEGRLVSWPVELATGWLSEDADGDVRGMSSVVGAQSKMQGALTYDGTYYISSSGQISGGFGRLYRTRPGMTSSFSAWVYGCEDLYMERDSNRIWTAAEHPGLRDTVSIHRFPP